MSLLVSRRRAVSRYPREGAKKEVTFNGLQDPDRPFRRAKLTACRKVWRIYRRHRAKSRQSREKVRWRKHMRAIRKGQREAGSRRTRFEL